jgi:hypothetical protein
MMRDMKLRGSLNSFTLILALCLSFFLGLTLPASARALIVNNMYFQEMPVEGQGDAERIRAYREGLSRVILKITGEERWLRNSAVERIIRDAQSYVQEVSYRSTPGGLGQQTYISVRFDSQLVDDALMSSGISVWDRSRPAVLLWLTVQAADGRRELLGSDSEHPLLDLIREFSQSRGLPVLIPALDFEDRRGLPSDVAWSLDEAAIRRASARYGADAIMSGRVLESPTGDLVGMWQFMFRDRVESFDSVEQDMTVYVDNALSRITGQLATHFAINRLAAPANSRITLQVEGIDSAKAYVDLLDYMQELAVVERVSAALLNGAEIELDISLFASPFVFAEFISLGRDLIPADDALELNQDSQVELLRYRWVR